MRRAAGRRRATGPSAAGRRAALGCVLGLSLWAVPIGRALGSGGGAPGTPTGRASLWSAPVSLGAPGCPADGGPLVAFPSLGPSTPTGPGAIVWPARCAGRAAVAHAAVGTDGRAGPARGDRLPGAAGGPLAAVGGTEGRLAVAAAPGAAVAVLEGRADRPLADRTGRVGGRPFALTRSYLDDVALATVEPGPVIAVRLESHTGGTFGRPRRIVLPRGRVTALTVGMDYRADLVVAWQQDGAIHADTLRANGHADPVQRVGPARPDPQLRALISDDLRDHGMFAWSTAGPSGRTREYLAFSVAGAGYGRPELLASFSDPRGLGRGPGALGLVRLSTENVVLAWTTRERGHFVVRTSAAHFATSRPTTRLSSPAGQSVLADLAAGPAGEAIALWRSAPAGPAPGAAGAAELWAARISLNAASRLQHRAGERVAGPGSHGTPSIGVDPASDRAVAAWLDPATRAARIGYATRPGYGTRTALAGPAHPRPGHRLRIAAAAAAVLALLGLGLRRRGRRHR